MDQLEISRAGSEDRWAMPTATSEMTRDRAETKMAKGTENTSQPHPFPFQQFVMLVHGLTCSYLQQIGDLVFTHSSNKQIYCNIYHRKRKGNVGMSKGGQPTRSC
nr:uncharacterized protein LOC116425423 [Nomia melanderi]